MQDEQAAKLAAAAEARRLGDLGAQAVTLDDLRQYARFGVWQAADEIVRQGLIGNQRDAAMVRAGRSAIVDAMRHEHGRSPAMRAARRAIRVETIEEIDRSDCWASDPERVFKATQALAGLPKKLEMLAFLAAGGYTGDEIAEFMSRDKAIVSRLRKRLGDLLEHLL
jgi:hypothetical protein